MRGREGSSWGKAQTMADHHLPSSGLGSKHVSEQQRSVLYAKYGDLTRNACVAPTIVGAARARQQGAVRVVLPALPAGAGGISGGRAPMMRARDDGLSEYVTRREMEDRLAQMDMRISLLANALRRVSC